MIPLGTGMEQDVWKNLKETTHFKTEIDLSGQAPALYLINLVLEEYRTSRPLIVE